MDYHFSDGTDLVNKLNSAKWFNETKINLNEVNRQIWQNDKLQNLPKEFPLYTSISSFWPSIIGTKDFIEYYQTLRQGQTKYEFIFSHLVDLFLAADFNGAYIFVDDFERIPDFQSERQKRDFAVEIRSCLFDGLYTSTKVGFYVLMLVLHAGIPRLIQNAWAQSGLEHRTPIFYKGDPPKHVIRFEKITLEYTFALLCKYLGAYRIKETKPDDIFPFEKNAIVEIAERSEFNAARILKMAYEVLERAATSSVSMIDVDFITNEGDAELVEEKQSEGIYNAPTIDLMKEAE